jgi:hypothetical protein
MDKLERVKKVAWLMACAFVVGVGVTMKEKYPMSNVDRPRRKMNRTAVKAASELATRFSDFLTSEPVTKLTKDLGPSGVKITNGIALATNIMGNVVQRALAAEETSEPKAEDPETELV